MQLIGDGEYHTYRFDWHSGTRICMLPVVVPRSRYCSVCRHTWKCDVRVCGLFHRRHLHGNQQRVRADKRLAPEHCTVGCWVRDRDHVSRVYGMNVPQLTVLVVDWMQMEWLPEQLGRWAPR